MEPADVLTRDEQLDLVNRLIRLTERHAIDWQNVQSAGFAYWASLSQHSYRIESVDDDGVAPYRLTVDTRGGRTLAVVEMRPPTMSGQEVVNNAVRDLYELVHRFVSRSERDIKMLFEDLDDVESGNAPPF